MPAPTPVVCALIVKEGRVLVAKRPEGKRLAGYWEFPGGKMEAGESAEMALIREIQEELGCKVENLHPGPAVTFAYEWGAILLFPFVCRLQANSPAPIAHEHTEIAWLLPCDLAGVDLAPADLPVLAWFLQRSDAIF